MFNENTIHDDFKSSNTSWSVRLILQLVIFEKLYPAVDISLVAEVNTTVYWWSDEVASYAPVIDRKVGDSPLLSACYSIMLSYCDNIILSLSNAFMLL